MSKILLFSFHGKWKFNESILQIFQSTNQMHDIDACSFHELIYLFFSTTVYIYASNTFNDVIGCHFKSERLALVAISFQYQRLSQDFYSTICYLNNEIKTISNRPFNNCSQLTFSSIERIESILFESEPVGRFHFLKKIYLWMSNSLKT